MKVNWKVRVKNPLFWISLIGVIFSPVLAAMGIKTVDLSTWNSILDVLKTFVSNPYLIGTAFMAVLTFLGVTNDPTTSTLNDSDRAMTYRELK
ncbi:phage holin [Anaerovorax sp. IOR16]|uniref:phage holin n=1 Tax=Anaerovorax sp. IOR16 TaxID=2773458 RepID=UPI0019D00788|nr:phage holin [Anaerovorax sp. IOR16]